MPVTEIAEIALEAAQPVSQPQTVKNLQAPSAVNKHIPELDGLRGLSAVVVVLYHYLYWVARENSTVHWIHQGIALLPATVDMFFILSGFLISGILLQNRQATNYYKVFYMRRFYRILPLYYVWLVPYFVLLALRAPDWGLVIPKGYSLLQMGLIFFLAIQNNFLPLMQEAFWVVPTWTLGIEEPFYLVAPYCFKHLTKKRLAWVSGGVVAFSILFRFYVFVLAGRGPVWGDQAANYFTLSRLSTPAIGALLAIGWVNPRVNRWFHENGRLFYAGIIGLAASDLIIIHLRRIGIVWPTFLEQTLMSAASVCVILAVVAHRKGILARFMRTDVLRHLGKISYGIYISHYGILWAIFRFVLHKRFLGHPGLQLLIAPVACLVCLAFSELSYKYFEEPLLKRGHQHKYIQSAA